MNEVLSCADPTSAAHVLPRSQGSARVSLRQADGVTRLQDLYQQGCMKLRLPRGTSECAEVVLINTAGGLTGGDRITTEIRVGEEAMATVTTPGSERIYRALAGDAVIEQRMAVGPAGRLDWLPQETILFDGGRLRRRIDLDLCPGAEATIAEAILLGRPAMGETVASGLLSDQWTVRRDGRLIFADAMHIGEGFRAAADTIATLDGQIATATLIHIGPEMEAKRDAVRAAFDEAGAMAGASIVGDVLVARIVAAGNLSLRRALIPALSVLRNDRPLPRLWTC